MVGLGCEGVPAAEVSEQIRQRDRSSEVLTIQGAGGTIEAGMQARAMLTAMASDTPRHTASLADWVLGVGEIGGLGDWGRRIVSAFLERGGRLIEGVGDGPHLAYGERMPREMTRAVMAGGAGTNEVITGLVASGAQIVLAQSDAENVGGHPIAPVIRIGYDERLRHALCDDMDGMVSDRTPEGWADWIVDVANGVPTMAEQLGVATFAIQRIGPTL